MIAPLEPAPDRLVTVISVGLVVAAAAEAFGFSLAIGAFFGGVALSRDPERLKLDAYFDPLYELFTLLFFVAIGMRVDPQSLGDALPLGLLLFVVAARGGSLVLLSPRRLSVPVSRRRCLDRGPAA